MVDNNKNRASIKKDIPRTKTGGGMMGNKPIIMKMRVKKSCPICFFKNKYFGIKGPRRGA